MQSGEVLVLLVVTSNTAQSSAVLYNTVQCSDGWKMLARANKLDLLPLPGDSADMQKFLHLHLNTGKIVHFN